MKQIQYNIACFFFVFATMQAQEGMVHNKGVFVIKPQSQIGVKGSFINANTGDVLNDGEIHFYNHYTNEGLFSYTTNRTTGYVVFSGNTSNVQDIKGSSPSFFYNVLFNKISNQPAFNVTNETTYSGNVNLSEGVVLVDKEMGGAFVFLPGATHINTSNRSHVDGEVIKEGKESFKYPIGNGGFYRMAGISAPTNIAESLSGQYFFENPTISRDAKNRTGIIEEVNQQEYWVIQPTKDTNESVLLTLSWDNATTPSSLLQNDAKELHIIRWDENQKLWVDEGGVVDFASQTITTPVKVDGYGVFTLGRIRPHLLFEGDVVIYNSVTPNSDGMNDYFIIDNIQNFPRNTVSIYSRWGQKVFETEAYDTNGNVFTGVAQGKGVVSSGRQLPSGTYYYILEYYTTNNGVEKLNKKVGYLHLESIY